MTEHKSLDPENWEDFTELAHDMVDAMVAYLRGVDGRTAWQRVPSSVRRRLSEPPPYAPQGLREVYEQFLADVLPYPTGNIYPRFWANVLGTGSPVSMMAEMLAAAMNSNTHGYDQSAIIVEQQTIRWLLEIFGFPGTASGAFTSGCTMANIVGLLAARSAMFASDIADQGVVAMHDSVIYASTQAHSWLRRACNVLGFGHRAIHLIETNADYSIDVSDLADAVAADRAGGRTPFCVVGNCGTVNTGASDDLVALGRYARAANLWFHVDGAFGALAVLAPKSRAYVLGIEEADSLAFDLHKWGYLTYDIGCILVRDESAHRVPLMNPAPYLAAGKARGFGASFEDEGFDVSPYVFSDLTLQLSRSFKALKAWMTMKSFGFDAIGAAIQKNIDQASYFAGLVEESDDLELLAPVPLNVVCFRFAPPGRTDLDLNALNARILDSIQLSGEAMPSSTELNGTFCLRIAITNHRTTFDDLDVLLRLTRQHGRAMTKVTTQSPG